MLHEKILMKKIKFILFFLMLAIFIGLPAWAAPSRDIDVVMFTSKGCPHCAKMKAWVDELKRDNFPGLNFTEFEITQIPANQTIFAQYSKAFNFNTRYVPVTIIGDSVINGEDYDGLKAALMNCNLSSCNSPQSKVAAYLEQNPNINFGQTVDTSQSNFVGWIALGVIGVLVVGVLVFSLKNKKR